MKRTAIQTSDTPAQAKLRERYASLGLPVWRSDAGGVFAAEPDNNGFFGEWLRSPFIAGVVRRCVERWSDEAEPTLAEAFPGCWLIPIIEGRRRRRRSFTVVMCLGEEAVTSEQFAAACQSAGLDERVVRSAIASLATGNAHTAGQMARMVAWSGADLDSLDQAETTVEEFNRQLTESYEGITLLYALGQSMNQLIQPQKFIAQACREIQATLTFRWIAVKVSPSSRDARGMAGRLFIAGDLPCEQDRFDADATSIVERFTGTAGRVIQATDAADIVREGFQVLAHPVIRNGSVVAVFLAGDKLGDDPQVSSVDMKLLDAAAGYTGIVLDNAFLYDSQQMMFVGTLEALTAAIDAKDPYTCGHSQRVAHLAAALAAAHGLDNEEVERIRITGLVHDVGKIGVPEIVLRKCGRLTDEEFRQIQAHPEIGYRILKDIPALEDVLPGVLHHHERYDGKGYPARLSGLKIPLVARIVGLADAFDAMSSNRTYRAAMPREQVLREVRTNAGTQFDPNLVESFMRIDLRQYDELVDRHMADRDGQAQRGVAA